MSDSVNHPSHYTAFPVEVIDIIRVALGREGFKAYCFGNEIKYRMRAGLKGDNAAEDIAKAMAYKEFRDGGREMIYPLAAKLDAAHADACRRHPDFPDALDSMGTILAEELLEVSTAGMAALQAINDHRDDGAHLDNVRVELTHVHAVVQRMLEVISPEMD